ncbi:MAG: murein hydrolase activator EnvC family protein [Saprospiraceae bacterium]
MFHKKNHSQLKIVLLLLVLFVQEASPQRNRRELEKKRQRLIEAMSITKSELSETLREKQRTARKQDLLASTIEQQTQKIEQVNRVITNASELAERNYEVVNALSGDLTRIKNDYGETIRRGFRQKLNYSLLTFLFSSDNFNHLLKRLYYLRQIDRFRKKQIRSILDTKDELEARIVQLEQGMAKNAEVKEKIVDQKMELGQKLSVAEEVLSGLSTQEQKLRRELRKQERNHEKLSAAIDNIIKAEIEENARIARAAALALRKTRIPSSPEAKTENKREELKEESLSLKETPEVKELSRNFRSNQGKLPWPVKNGAISSRFGKQQHASLKNVYIENHGIDITTNEGADVQAIFGGKVVAVQFLPESNYLIILQHGNYYTVYSNLDRVYVKKGDEVSFKKNIGKVAGNSMHFELWQNREKENPSRWIAKN